MDMQSKEEFIKDILSSIDNIKSAEVDPSLSEKILQNSLNPESKIANRKFGYVYIAAALFFIAIVTYIFLNPANKLINKNESNSGIRNEKLKLSNKKEVRAVADKIEKNNAENNLNNSVIKNEKLEINNQNPQINRKGNLTINDSSKLSGKGAKAQSEKGAARNEAKTLSSKSISPKDVNTQIDKKMSIENHSSDIHFAQNKNIMQNKTQISVTTRQNDAILIKKDSLNITSNIVKRKPTVDTMNNIAVSKNIKTLKDTSNLNSEIVNHKSSIDLSNLNSEIVNPKSSKDSSNLNSEIVNRKSKQDSLTRDSLSKAKNNDTNNRNDTNHKKIKPVFLFGIELL